MSSAAAPPAPATSSAPAAVVQDFIVSLPVAIPNAAEFGAATALDQNDTVKFLLRFFAEVQLTRVKVFLCQITAQSAGVAGQYVRYGLVPRDLAFSAGPANSVTALMQQIPHLHDMILGSTVNSTASAIWTGADFPPGLQVDFRASELRHKLPHFAIFKANSSAVSLNGTIELTFTCAGRNFGAPVV